MVTTKSSSMASSRTAPDLEALARWDVDGGAPKTAPATTALPQYRADAAPVVRLLGLSTLVVIDARSGTAAFPLGILYPYTAELRRVCAAFDAASRAVPDAASAAALLASIATLHSRIGFALSPATSAVIKEAYDTVEKELTADRAVPLVLRRASS